MQGLGVQIPMAPFNCNSDGNRFLHQKKYLRLPILNKKITIKYIRNDDTENKTNFRDNNLSVI